jgi:hypothetical protein
MHCAELLERAVEAAVRRIELFPTSFVTPMRTLSNWVCIRRPVNREKAAAGQGLPNDL